MEKMLNDEIQAQIREAFEPLSHKVRLNLFTSTERQCEYCEAVSQLLNELAPLSDKIMLEEFDLDKSPEAAKEYQINEVPVIMIAGEEDGKVIDYGIRYAGIPSGHEFASLIQSILMVSRRDSGLSDDTRKALSELEAPLKLQVFVTPTCGYCPPAVVLAHQMALESKYVEAWMVEAMEFPELSSQYRVSGVPHTIINNGAGELVGAVPEEMLLGEIQKSLAV
ncbi:MAG: thioredoxin family protein [Anaerolineaceae bacterium]|nr:thioredoxin family protein [Anaerolineaceae bacterium]